VLPVFVPALKDSDWKDADPDIPILKQAQAEYAKLPSPSLNHLKSRLITRK